MRYEKLEVVISGAVNRSGRTVLEPGSTVASALQAAGGLAWRRNTGPAGELVLRRRLPSSRSVSVYRWSIFEDQSQHWRSFPLEHRDVLVFEWFLHGDSA